jgi:hypothetical protein
MTIPIPSAVRTVRIYSGAQMLATRGISPVAPYRWTPKHPLDVDWWWVDATGWCADIGDVLGAFTTGDVAFSGGDGGMSIIATTKSTDNLQAGIRFIGGTSGVAYSVTVTLRGSLGADTEAIDIAFPCSGLLPQGLGTPWFADFSNPDNSAAYYYL